ncbi:MAG TPA: hypothetical protein VFJ82_22800 [Longimicrobium sp.]|nr:hypothetical protein [Longimicrobium sp.]
MRKLIVTLAALVAAAQPLAAQQHQHDPDHHVAGGGTLPAGWMAHLDRADATLGDVKFTPMGGGFHVTTGPAVILWNPAQNVAGGNFTAHATFAQTKAPMHPEAYGLFIGGSNLSGTAPEYFYFIVRGDGKYMVRHRAANGDVHTIQDWTENAAIHKQDEQGQATNALAVEGGDAGLRFKVNGTQVAELPNVKGTGQVGLRVNHNLDVHVSDFGVDHP